MRAIAWAFTIPSRTAVTAMIIGAADLPLQCRWLLVAGTSKPLNWRRLVAQHRLGAHQIALADALAPFAPELALELIEGAEGIHAPVGLRAALLLRVGQGDQAAAILRDAVQAGNAHQLPELNLLLSNAEPGSPLQQLTRMNAFLAAYALTPLALRDASLPPGQMNLRSGEPHHPAPVRGPLVSVLMTAYQSGQRIEFAITSLLEQSYRDRTMAFTMRGRCIR